MMIDIVVMGLSLDTEQIAINAFDEGAIGAKSYGRAEMTDTPTSREAPPTSGDAALPSDPPDGAKMSTAPATRARGRRGRRIAGGTRHTRISGVWTAVFVAVVLGVALIDFIVENTRKVRVDFFSASGRMPVAVALLAAAVAGAAVVLAVGVCRTAQLRLTLRRHRRQPNVAAQADVQPSTDLAEGAQR
jgi:uncharacterized integral membrane protein